MNNNSTIYVSTTFAKDNSKLSDVISECLDGGINNIELGSNHCYEKNYNYLRQLPLNYLIHNYFPIPKDSFVLNIASFNSFIRERSIKHVCKAIDFCDSIGGMLYTFHPGFLTDPEGSNITQNNYDFIWNDNELDISNYDKALNLMYSSLDKIVEYATKKRIKIAIETEGSITKKDHLLMQRPEEYLQFINRYKNSDISINLNIGHLNLASRAFNFSPFEFVDLIKNYIVAMELSHNDGLQDQHLPLKKDGWYWDIILDSSFKNTFKILEFRNTSINDILSNIKIYKEKLDAV